MNIKDKLYAFFSIRLVQHLSYWMFFILLLMIRFIDMEPYRLKNELIFELSQFSVIILFVYFNLRYLISRYWNRGEYAQYIINLVMYEALIVVFLSITLYLYPDIHVSRFANSPMRIIFMNLFKTNILVFTSSLFHFVKEWIKLKDENLKFTEKAQEQLEAELNLLKAQVNPHFLFNTLNNIYSLSLYDSKKTPEMILKLSQLISYMLYECKDEEVSLEKEIQFIKNYIDLESVRVEDIARINFNITGEDPGHKIPPLLFIPLIENAFKHGIAIDQETSVIDIDLRISADNIELKTNNPVNRSDSNSLSTQGGLGIDNVRKRLELLFPKSHSLIITHGEKEFNTLVSLTLK